MTTYLGLSVLEQRSNAVDDPSTHFTRDTDIFDPGNSKQSVVTKALGPNLTTDYLWTCKTKAEIAALKQWFFERRGALVPFWVPTWRQDLIVASDATATDTQITVKQCGYTRYAYPLNARRHLAIHFLDGSIIYRKATSSEDLGDIEIIHFTGALGKTLSAGTWVSYLAYCRLASDDLVINYHTDSIAEAKLGIFEVPAEAP